MGYTLMFSNQTMPLMFTIGLSLLYVLNSSTPVSAVVRTTRLITGWEGWCLKALTPIYGRQGALSTPTLSQTNRDREETLKWNR
jgi:hypothetical protein